MSSDLRRMHELVALLSTYAYQYYVLEEPTVSDAIYDSLIQELKKLEAAHPEAVLPDSPTQRVHGRALDSFAKVAHQTPMISLNDVFDEQDVSAWVTRMDKLLPGAEHEFFCDTKKDGLACALIYQDGLLVQALTRGDSKVGEDVTQNVRTIANVPLRLRAAAGYEQFLAGRTEIRGEIVIYKRDFAELNKQREATGQPIFANPRNLAAGTIRQLDATLVAERPLRFVGYDVLRADVSDVPTSMYAYQAMSALGIFRSPEASIHKSLRDVLDFVHAWSEKRHDLPYNTDGLVVKVNDRKYYDNLGVVGKCPRGAVAYKYPAEEATTVLRDIVISIGRTGAATPVAVFEPVVVAGTTVRHASLHNADEIERLDVRIGDTVVIFKAGDIIPQVNKVVLELRPSGAKRYNFEAELARQFPDVAFSRPDNEVVYRVVGATGPIMLKRALEHFASKGALDIDGLGDKNVVALVDAGLVQDLADIFTITKAQLLALERFAELSASNLIEAIAQKRTVSLPRFLYGLGIRHVGAQTAIDLAARYKRLDDVGTASYESLKSVEGVGEIVAESILAWFADDDNMAMLAKFRRLGVWPEDYRPVQGKLEGMSFVLTGSLSTMGRDAAAEKIRSAGGIFQSAVAKGTTYLVVGSGKPGSKVAKAQKLGVQIIDEERFLELL